MNTADFEDVVARRISAINKVLGAKAKEYSSDKDRLHNFKVAAALQGTTPEKALWGMMVKHLVSAQDMVCAVHFDTDVPAQSYVDEKLGDIINYCILLDALLEERRKPETQCSSWAGLTTPVSGLGLSSEKPLGDVMGLSAEPPSVLTKEEENECRPCHCKVPEGEGRWCTACGGERR